MCTSSSDRKIVTCRHAPAGASPGRRVTGEHDRAVGRRQHERPVRRRRAGPDRERTARSRAAAPASTTAPRRAPANANTHGAAPPPGRRRARPARSIRTSRDCTRRRPVQPRTRGLAAAPPARRLVRAPARGDTRAVAAAHDRLDAIFQRQFLFLQGDFFVLLLVGEVGIDWRGGESVRRGRDAPTPAAGSLRRSGAARLSRRLSYRELSVSHAPPPSEE